MFSFRLSVAMISPQSYILFSGRGALPAGSSLFQGDLLPSQVSLQRETSMGLGISPCDIRDRHRGLKFCQNIPWSEVFDLGAFSTFTC
jgi:hypothetical protein